MMINLPDDAPKTLGEAFARINSVTAPTITDLKVMVLVEAAGQTLYEKSAEGATDPRVKALLIENGHEEMKHARRAAEVVKLLTGEEFPAPDAADNPYLTGHIPVAALTPKANLRATSFMTAGPRTLTIQQLQKCCAPMAGKKPTMATACWKPPPFWRAKARLALR